MHQTLCTIMFVILISEIQDSQSLSDSWQKRVCITWREKASSPKNKRVPLKKKSTQHS